KRRRKGLVPTKTALSLLFIVAVLVQPHPIARYYHLLLIGLIFCLIGDVCLALPQQKMFLLGLVSFLIGHVFYVLCFFSVTHTNAWTWVGSLIVLLVSGTVYFWLRPHLGSMNIPVLFYIIVISIMIAGACSLLGNPDLSRSGRIMAFAGAVTFYFSDVFVARDRFLKKEFLNRLIGLPMYYTAQFLLAFSVGFLNWLSTC
ncbi:MAG: lysoplasmalogenase, partial [Desulfobacteraceae bacterium]|nr:lysoplasmalogenase [Desulfobacteraceae bacterium]